ncbi:hypothetical protein M0R45_016773 [Rubus argutus]|uniref:Uncharacterized protein n=1 Tax=Rubus argutus TaxID=59490 RepID=A0AAW1XUB0_RUBAR
MGSPISPPPATCSLPHPSNQPTTSLIPARSQLCPVLPAAAPCSLKSSSPVRRRRVTHQPAPSAPMMPQSHDSAHSRSAAAIPPQTNSSNHRRRHCHLRHRRPKPLAVSPSSVLKPVRRPKPHYRCCLLALRSSPRTAASMLTFPAALIVNADPSVMVAHRLHIHLSLYRLVEG